MANQMPPRAAVAAAFLASLPMMKLDELPEHSQICHICKEHFFGDHNRNPEEDDGNNNRNPDEDEDTPLKLPCNHIMGYACLATWLKHNNSCPLCRATLCEQTPSPFANIISQLPDAEFAILSQRSTEALRDVNALDADANFLTQIALENAEMLERLIEVRLGPQTRESREESSRIMGLLERNEELIGEIEGSVRGLRGRVDEMEVELLRVMGFMSENGVRRGGE